MFETYVDSFGFLQVRTNCRCAPALTGINESRDHLEILSHNIQRNFLRILKEEGIHVTEQENDFPGYQEKKLGLMQKSMQIFTFCVLLRL